MKYHNTSDSDTKTVRKRPRQLTSDERCVICLTNERNDLMKFPTSFPTTLTKPASDLQDYGYLTLRPYIKTSQESLPCTWHRSCLRKYARKAERHVGNLDKEPIPTSKDMLVTGAIAGKTPQESNRRQSQLSCSVATRAANVGHQWDKTLCTIFQKHRCRGNVTVQLCQTLGRSKKLKDAATFHIYDAGLRILSCLDLVAVDAVFHKRCSDLYLLEF